MADEPSAQDGAILADYRNEAECSLIKAKDAKVSPKGKMQNAAPFLKERVDRSH